MLQFQLQCAQRNSNYNKLNVTHQNAKHIIYFFSLRFPQFATTNEQNIPQQQDAEECLREMFSVISNLEGGSDNLIDRMFGFKMKSK
jgi:hypothetical protein